jgi:hypothetical protein
MKSSEFTALQLVCFWMSNNDARSMIPRLLATRCLACMCTLVRAKNQILNKRTQLSFQPLETPSSPMQHRHPTIGKQGLVQESTAPQFSNNSASSRTRGRIRSLVRRSLGSVSKVVRNCTSGDQCPKSPCKYRELLAWRMRHSLKFQ